MSSLGVIIAQLTFQKHFRKVPKISLSKEFNRVSGLNRPSQNVNKQNCQLKSRKKELEPHDEVELVVGVAGMAAASAREEEAVVCCLAGY